MKNIENFKQPEQPKIDFEELEKIIDHLEFEDYEIFEFNDRDYCIILTDKDADITKESSGVIFGSTYVNGFDIYIPESLPKERKKRIILHEIIESQFLRKGLSSEKAHERTLQIEKEYFSSEE